MKPYFYFVCFNAIHATKGMIIGNQLAQRIEPIDCLENYEEFIKFVTDEAQLKHNYSLKSVVVTNFILLHRGEQNEQEN